MLVDYLATSDSRWEALLREVPHDIYHLPQYLEVSALHEGGEPTAFLAQEGTCFFLTPLLIRPLPPALGAPEHWCDAKSPYGYAAPLFRGDGAWPEKALSAFVRECRARSLISAFFCMHPLLPFPHKLARYGDLVRHAQTVYVDLSLTDEQLWSQVRERSRSYIRKLERAGFQAHFNDWSTYSEFVNAYDQTMERVQANEVYRFSEQYFRDLRSALGPRLHYCAVVDAHAELACGALFTETQGIAQYHLSGTADKFLADAPSKLMISKAILWAKAMGCRVLHLGGGRGARADSLFHFKTGFSPLRSDFFTYRLVCDESKYACLSRRIGAKAIRNEYFPQYRRSA